MLRAYLVSDRAGDRALVDSVLTIGRTRDCNVVIDDGAASRRHVEIKARDGGFVWKDLGSTNGTLINGKHMLGGKLKDGDLLQIGESVFRFEIEHVPDAPGTPPESKLFQETILDDSVERGKPLEGDRKTALLEAVYSVVNAIARNYHPCHLLDQILETTMRAVDAQRGAIFLAGPTDELLPCPECGQVHRIVEGHIRPASLKEIPISSTVVQRVLRGGESVLYKDTDHDTELNASESIMDLKLRSILCAPLRAKQGILGILYIDSDRTDKSYSEDDLLLAAAVGNSAGLALDNARMHQEILEKQRIEQEIDTAWSIQEGFLVKDWPDHDPRFKIYGETRPAKRVGGDFYDFVQPRPDTVGMLIGDVSGKGVPAALTMAQLLAEFRLIARDIESPAEVLAALNTELVARTRYGIFCTLCYLTLNLETGAVTTANAGHHAILHLGQQQFAHSGDASGPPVGVLNQAEWHNEEFTIAPGDSLLLYTDGIVEARSMSTRHEGDGDAAIIEYETKGLEKAARVHYGQNPKVLIDAINNDVQRFCAPGAPHDDCTMVALRYLGHGN